MDEQGNIIIYQSEDGVVRLDVRLEDKTVWLTIDQMSELFGKSRSTINEHILNIYRKESWKKRQQREKSEFLIFLRNRLTSITLTLLFLLATG